MLNLENHARHNISRQNMQTYTLRRLLFFTLLSACATPPIPEADIPEGTLQTIVFETSDLQLRNCGLEGNLSARLRSCAELNPAYAWAKHDFDAPIWQLVALQNQPYLRIWLDLRSKIFWSHVIDEEDLQEACKTLPKIPNGDRDLMWDIPSVEDYRQAFEHTLPADLMEEDTELFVTQSTKSTGEVVNEWQRLFLLAPKDQVVYARCTSR